MSGVSRPWTLRDAAPGEFLPTFPGLQVHLVITDGCGCHVYLHQMPTYLFPILRTYPSPPPLHSLNAERRMGE